MNERAEKYEAFLDDLALVVDGDAAALERHADFLVDDDGARDTRHEAASTAEQLKDAGADYVHPEGFAERVLASIDAGVEDSAQPGRTTSPGFALPSTSGAHVEPSPQPVAGTAAADVAVSSASVSSASMNSEVVSSGGVRRETVRGESAPEPIVQPPAADKSRRMGKLLFFPLVGVLGLAAAAAAVGVYFMGKDDAVPGSDTPRFATGGMDGSLERIDRAADDGRSGVEIQRHGADDFVALGATEAIEAGSTIRTDERTRARVRLSDGSVLVLDHATQLEMVGDAPRTFRLRDGNLVADIAHLEEGPNARFETTTGSIEVLGTKFELSATNDVTNVRVSRGVVAMNGADGSSVQVRAGEEGVVRAGRAPDVAPVTNLANELAWAEIGGGEEQAGDEDTIAGIGSLRARRPGEREDHERPLTLATHSVRVRIVGNVARTEIEEVFRNDSDHTLEGIYRFPLPADAQIARLALDVEGRMEEGSFVERDRAAAIWRGVIRNATAVHQRRNDEEFIWVPGPWTDPAILEWQRGGQFELRIFPIPAHGERRVVLGYTQNVQPQGARRRYVYPLAHSADDSTRVGQFDVDVRVAGADSVTASGYDVSSANDDGATRLRLSETNFTPKGDLTIDYTLPGGEREVRWWTYHGEAASAPPANSREQDREVARLQQEMSEDQRSYVAFALRPDLPRASERRSRDFVLVVDSSQSMFGERYQRATRLATNIVREMDRRDRFTILACDYQCQVMPGGIQPPSTQASRAAQEWLDSIEPAGASDITAVLREAVATISAERREDRELHVTYIGDGTSTVGYRRAASLAAEVRAVAEAEHVAVSTVGVGGDADTMALRAIARSAGGHYVPYIPGQRISVAAMAVLETSYGASLDSPRVEMPDGLSEVAPAELPTVRAGQELIVVARMDRERVAGAIVLRGTVAGRPFERRYDVDLVPTDAAGNRFVPGLWAAARIEQMQLSGRGEERGRIIAMSKAFGVMSRHTSLLVLESEAMFRAFRVDRNESQVAQWTGEEDVVVGGEQGEAFGVGQGSGGTGGLMAGGNSVLGGALRGRSGGGASGGGMRAESSARARPRSSAAAEPAADMLDDAIASGAVARTTRDNRWQEREARPAPDQQVLANPGPQQPPVPEPVETMRRQPARRPGQWMRRVWVRSGQIDRSAEPSQAVLRAADEAEARLAQTPDSRDRHRDAVRELARAGRLDRALEIAEAWVERDREDAEALTAKADLLGRMGHRDEALRLLTGTVDLAPNSGPLHRRLMGAFERAGQPERACAHRIALAEIDENNPNAVADAMRCERALGRDQAASRILYSVREGSVRTRAERLAQQEDSSSRFRGDFTIDGQWSGGDLDLTILTAQGTRLSWMGGRTTVVGEHTSDPGREQLGLRWTGQGTYVIEVNRTDPNDTSEIRGRLDVRILGERQSIPFTLTGERTAVAQVRVTRTSRLETVTGTVGPMGR